MWRQTRLVFLNVWEKSNIKFLKILFQVSNVYVFENLILKCYIFYFVYLFIYTESDIIYICFVIYIFLIPLSSFSSLLFYYDCSLSNRPSTSLDNPHRFEIAARQSPDRLLIQLAHPWALLLLWFGGRSTLFFTLILFLILLSLLLSLSFYIPFCSIYLSILNFALQKEKKC